MIDFNFYQNYRQRYAVIPITTVRGPFIGIKSIHMAVNSHKYSARDHNYIMFFIETKICIYFADLALVQCKMHVTFRRDVISWTSSRERLTLLHAKNEVANQPAQPRSLISAFVFRSLQSILSKLASYRFICMLFELIHAESYMYLVGNPQDRVFSS